MKSTDRINHKRSNRLSRVEDWNVLRAFHPPTARRRGELPISWPQTRRVAGTGQSASVARGPETRRRPPLPSRPPSYPAAVRTDGCDLGHAGSLVCLTVPALPLPSPAPPSCLSASQQLAPLGARRPSPGGQCCPQSACPPPSPPSSPPLLPPTMEPVACPFGGGPAFVAVGLSAAAVASSTASAFHGTRTRLVPVRAAAAAGRRVSALPGALPRRAAPGQSSGVAGLRADADYYSTLGVSRSASQEEIKKSFRKLARKYHPVRLSGGSRGVSPRQCGENGESGQATGSEHHSLVGGGRRGCGRGSPTFSRYPAVVYNGHSAVGRRWERSACWPSHGASGRAAWLTMLRIC